MNLVSPSKDTVTDLGVLPANKSPLATPGVDIEPLNISGIVDELEPDDGLDIDENGKPTEVTADAIRNSVEQLRNSKPKEQRMITEISRKLRARIADIKKSLNRIKNTANNAAKYNELYTQLRTLNNSLNEVVSIQDYDELHSKWLSIVHEIQ